MFEKPWLKNYDKGISPTLNYPEKPLFFFLDDAAKNFPDHPSIFYQEKIYNYAYLKRLTDHLAAALLRSGLKKGDRIGVCLPNIPQFVICFYAVLKAGGVVVAINPNYKEKELLFQLNDAGIEFLFILNDIYELIQKIRPQTRVKSLVITSKEDAEILADDLKRGLDIINHTSTLSPDDYWLMDLLKENTKSSSDVFVYPHDEAIYQYSGGTTGTPKAAVATHQNLVANTIQFRTWLSGLQEGREVFLAAIPLFHVYGMVIGMSVAIASAAAILIIPDTHDIQIILSGIEKYKVTVIPGVPNLFQAICNNPDVISGNIKLKTLKVCISGSFSLLKETKEKFEYLTGGKLVEGYGLSEAPTATHCNPLKGENHQGSIGLPLPDVNCRIVGVEDGNTLVQQGKIGELVIKGPQVMKGYHDREKETREVLQDGWLHTGDIAYMDEEGYFYLVDRKKDMIKPGGFQVWPREVEETLLSNPAVLEAVVAGIPDSIRGEEVKAWIILKPGMKVTTEELISWCEERLVGYKVPVEIEMRSFFPRTTVGKVLKRDLVRQHLETNQV